MGKKGKKKKGEGSAGGEGGKKKKGKKGKSSEPQMSWKEALYAYQWVLRADSRFAPSQWETALLCNDVSHWLGANLESTLVLFFYSVIYEV